MAEARRATPSVARPGYNGHHERVTTLPTVAAVSTNVYTILDGPDGTGIGERSSPPGFPAPDVLRLTRYILCCILHVK
jgi:hypothetical protein